MLPEVYEAKWNLERVIELGELLPKSAIVCTDRPLFAERLVGAYACFSSERIDIFVREIQSSAI